MIPYFSQDKGLTLYLLLFLALNLFGVSFMSSNVWAPYTCNYGGSNPWSITSSCDIRATINPSSVDISSSSTVRVANGQPGTWLEQGPYTFFHIDEGSGSTIYDDSGNGYSGSLSGPVWTSGRFGNALDFDGSNDYVVTDFYASSAPAFTGGLTVSAWVYRQGSGTSSNNRIVTMDCSEYWCLLDEEGNGHVARWQVADNHDNYYVARSTNSIPTGSWTHLAGVWDSNAQEVRLYMNGNLVDTVTGTDHIGDGPTRYMVIGDGSEQTSASGSQNCCYFNGKIDEVRVYDHAVTSNAIKDLAGQTGKLQMNFLTDYLMIRANSKLVVKNGGIIGP